MTPKETKTVLDFLNNASFLHTRGAFFLVSGQDSIICHVGEDFLIEAKTFVEFAKQATEAVAKQQKAK